MFSSTYQAVVCRPLFSECPALIRLIAATSAAEKASVLSPGYLASLHRVPRACSLSGQTSPGPLLKSQPSLGLSPKPEFLP